MTLTGSKRPKLSSSPDDMDKESSFFSSSTTISTTGTSTSSLPPGPSGLPIVGNMLELKGPQTNLKWTEMYGPIYSIQMGNKRLVYINTIDLVEKYMEKKNGELFLSRPMGPAAIGEGILFGNGMKWQRNKKAFMKAMHTGTLVEDMENAINNEIDIMLEVLNKKAFKGKSVKVKIGDVLLPACANVVSGFLLGGSLPTGSPERESLHRIVKNMEGVDLTSKLTQITLKYPKMREPLKRIFMRDIVDMHGTSRRLQRLIRQWIRQTRSGEIFAKHHEATSTTPDAPQKCPFSHHAANTEQSVANTEEPVKGRKLSLAIPKPLTQVSTSCPVTIKVTNGSVDCPGTPKESRLERQENVDNGESTHDENEIGEDWVHLDVPAPPTNLTKMFISTESLLTMPKDDERMEEIMHNSSHMTSFGFSPIGPGEQPFEDVEPTSLTETPDAPNTPLTEFQWRFGREMSVNEHHDSILRRILDQPEYADMNETNEKELVQSLLDMFFGGVTSTLSGLEFVLLYLCKNPQMQLLAQQEIARVLASESEAVGGASKSRVTWSMRDQMPYLRACIVEALRLGSVTPSTLPHIASEDAEIEEFTIPKGTWVLGSIYSMHRDPKEYMDPHDYRPQRHLDCEGQFKLPKSYRPYGVGARTCAGERLAEMELFLFTATILREYDIKSTSSKKASTMETHMRIIHRLKDFKCILTRRK